MTAAERRVQLEGENTALRAENQFLRAENVTLRADHAQLRTEYEGLQAELKASQERLVRLTERLKALEDQVAKDSHNSSKPPSSDGLVRKTRSQRKQSDRKPGGQPGHPGHTLALVERPDVVERHRPEVCAHCQHSLEGVAGEVVERRQVHDLPPWRLLVSEHQLEQIICPQCQQPTCGMFPMGVSAPAQYGPGVQTLAVYLHQYQLVPTHRTCAALAELGGCTISEGTLLTWVQQAAATLEPTMTQIAQGLLISRLQHADETGVRLVGKLHWLHVNSTRWLTHLAWHSKRGRQALDAIGIWPRFRGRAMRDRSSSYDQYACRHSGCGAHLLRDLTFVYEHEQQVWAGQMKDLLLDMVEAAREWRERGALRLPWGERDEWVGQYFDLLARGFAAQAPPEQGTSNPKDGDDSSRLRPRISWMTCCGEQSRCWRFWTISRSHSRTIKRSGICAWSKCSKRSLAPFAARQG